VHEIPAFSQLKVSKYQLPFSPPSGYHYFQLRREGRRRNEGTNSTGFLYRMTSPNNRNFLKL
jgi:hypothetical protein